MPWDHALMDVWQQDGFAGKRVFIWKDKGGYKGVFGTIIEHRNGMLFIQVDLIGALSAQVTIPRDNCKIQT
jgi:hypothetical protein